MQLCARLKQKSQAIFLWSKYHLAGIHGSTTPGSDNRRFTMRTCLAWSLGYFIYALFTHSQPQTEYSTLNSCAAAAFIIASILIFVQVVLLMPFRDDGQAFKIDVWRLLKDTIISSVFMIAAFSLLYKNVGLSFNGQVSLPTALNAVYFSSVTFSTLGYGDFSPAPHLRIIAATQAMFGNLHLGMVVGAVFSAIKR
ncbi:MAG: potassium channel family protein [Cognatishimia sp.]